jgi:hypothetical protein
VAAGKLAPSLAVEEILSGLAQARGAS